MDRAARLLADKITEVNEVMRRLHELLGARQGAGAEPVPLEESEELLDGLWEHMLQDRFTWRQDWQVGDLIWWDNRCAMHRRDAFDPATRRLMHRTQLKGTRPV